jgi:hypothetical protein
LQNRYNAADFDISEVYTEREATIARWNNFGAAYTHL